MRELIEDVVIPETSFFRDPESFMSLSDAIVTTWLPTHRGQVLRILSAPCSTGEEPYSIAMALLDAGLSSEQFQVEALDISTKALAIGTRASYGQNSFRNKNLDFRDRYFRKEKDCYQLADSVRRRVRFEQGNLLADDFLIAKSYDVIFCRNVLIYFDVPAQKQVIRTLSRLLAPQGLLFVGASEASLLRETGFVSASATATSAYRRGDTKEKRMTLPTAKPRRKRKALGSSRLPPIKAKTEKVVELPRADLETARRLGDAGRLVEAARICEAHLRTQSDSVSAY
jgi:chemotaxis protein methyltransferase WspC